MTSTEDTWPLHEAKLIAAFKVNDISVCHHTGENPYYQISVGGFVLDSVGGVLFADVGLYADDGDVEKVKEIENFYRPSSIHWLVCDTFFYADRSIHIINPESKPVPPSDYNSINEFFPKKIQSNREPDQLRGEFYYAGEIFKEGSGRFHGYKRQ